MSEPTIDVTLHRTDTLDAPRARSIRDLAHTAETADGVAPLSEDFLLHVAASDDAAPATSRHHVLAVGDAAQLLGYAQLDLEGRAAEFVVAPAWRRHGVGSALWSAIREACPDALVWSHGHLDGAEAFARARGLQVRRELWKMAAEADALRASGVPDDPRAVALPDGLVASTYTDADGPDWVAVNARAFANHPEQGRMTLDDVAARAAQDWFDPAGFFLLRDAETPGSPLAAFHWTKLADGEGEVYVVGVDPAYQGRGIAGPLTRLGLAHLLGRGAPRITLYVDGDNTRAVATYRRQGFERVGLDVQLG